MDVRPSLVLPGPHGPLSVLSNGPWNLPGPGGEAAAPLGGQSPQKGQRPQRAERGFRHVVPNPAGRKPVGRRGPRAPSAGPGGAGTCRPAGVS